MIEEKTQAPDFILEDQAGIEHALSDYLGGWVLLYFYPKDDTPGCTAEACSIRDSWDGFKQGGITVIGISADSVESHRKFAEKNKLPFILLSDPSKKVIQKYGAWKEKSMFGKSFMGIKRSSYLIDPNGNVAKVYPKVKPSDHAEEVLSDIANLN